MSVPTFAATQVGDQLPLLPLPPLTRRTLALYAGGSGDHNPLHIDIDFAKQAGFPDVFAHGMLGMAYLGRLLTGWAPQSALREFGVRFSAITYPGEVLTCTGAVVAKDEAGPERRVTVELKMQNAKGETKIAGRAIVALP